MDTIIFSAKCLCWIVGGALFLYGGLLIHAELFSHWKKPSFEEQLRTEQRERELAEKRHELYVPPIEVWEMSWMFKLWAFFYALIGAIIFFLPWIVPWVRSRI